MGEPANVNRNVISQLHRSNIRHSTHHRLPQSPQHQTRRNSHPLPPAPAQVSHKSPAKSRRIAPTVIPQMQTAAVNRLAQISWEYSRSKCRDTIRAMNILARKKRTFRAKSGSVVTKSLQKPSPSEV